MCRVVCKGDKFDTVITTVTTPDGNMDKPDKAAALRFWRHEGKVFRCKG